MKKVFRRWSVERLRISITSVEGEDTGRPQTKRNIIYGILSLLIIFHLSCLIILPNPRSALSRHFPEFLVLYANTLGINHTWQFFSPNPGMERYIEYQLFYAGDETSDHLYWPPKEQKLIWENHKRTFYHSIVSSLSAERIENFLVPWLCRSTDRAAESVKINLVQYLVPSMAKTRLAEEGREEYLKPIYMRPQEHACPTAKEPS